MNAKHSTLIALLTLVGLLLGACLGFFTPDFALGISFIGNLFLQLLVLLALPLIISSIVTGVTVLGDYRKLGRTCGKTVLFFAVTGAVAVGVGLLVSGIVQPGEGARLSTAYKVNISGMSDHLANFFRAYISPNAVETVGGGQFLPIILFALLFGAVLSSVTAKAADVVRFFKGINHVLVNLVSILLLLAPIGLASLVATQIATYRYDLHHLSGDFAAYAVALAAAAVILGVVVLPLALKLLGQRSAGEFFGRTSPAILTAFGTASSSVTLPLTYESAVVRNSVDERAASLALPLGTFLNIGATAMFAVIAAMFVTQLAGGQLSILQMLLVAFAAMILSLGTAGLPAVSGSILLVTFSMTGLPDITHPGLGTVILIDLLFVDRLRAALNVWGDSVGSAVIAQTFELKTARTVTRDTKERPARTTPYRERASRERRTSKREDGATRTTDRRRRESGRPGGETRGRKPTRTTQTRRKRGEPTPSRERRGPGRGDHRQKDTETSPFDMAKTPSPAEHLEPNPAEDTQKTEKGPLDLSGKPASEKTAQNKEAVEPRQLRRIPPTGRDRGGQQRIRKAPHSGLPDDTIKRERAKIAAQLAAMKEKEADSALSRTPEPPERPKEREAAPSVDRAAERKEGDEGSRKTDFISTGIKQVEESTQSKTQVPDDEPGTPKTDAPAGQRPSEDERPTADDVVKSKPSEPEEDKLPGSSEEPQFGRSRTRKGSGAKTEETTEKPAVDEANGNGPADETAEFSNENISFGRTKRKRIR